MNILKIGIAGVAGSLILSDMIEQSMKNYDSDVIPPIDTVSIIMPAYNEESFIETSILSIKNQSILKSYPEYFELIVVDSNSTDKTLEIAKQYVNKIIMSPRGKLTARNIATNLSNGNIIVSVDADTYYPEHWLNTLLKPFSDSRYQNVVGTVGSTIDYSIPGLPKFIRNITEVISKAMHPNRMLGRNSAYYKHTFHLTGRFDENINQFNIDAILQEEEIGFGSRLSKIGNVVLKMNASCIHLGGQKIACRRNMDSKDACASYGIGKDRF